MSDKSGKLSSRVDVAIGFAFVALAVTLAINVGMVIRDYHDQARNLARLKAEVVSLKKAATPHNYDDELRTMRKDITVCHQRATDIWKALETVAKTCPGRARPPRIPNRKRPTTEGETSGTSIPNTPGGL